MKVCVGCRPLKGGEGLRGEERKQKKNPAPCRLPAEQLLGQTYPPEVNSKRGESLEIFASSSVRRLHRGEVLRRWRWGGCTPCGLGGWRSGRALVGVRVGVGGLDAALSTSDLSGKTLY